MVTLKISPYTNVPLTLLMRDVVREPYTEKKESNCQTKKLKNLGGPAPR
jgi:hypothetical protein